MIAAPAEPINIIQETTETAVLDEIMDDVDRLSRGRDHGALED